MFILVVAWQLFIVVTPLSVVRASNHNTISSSLGNSAVTHFFGASLLPGTWYFVINECRVPLSVTFQLSKWILLLFRSYNRLQFIRLFRHASPSSSFRCSRKRPSLLSLSCASGRLSFAVGEHNYRTRVLPFYNLFPRTYIRRPLIPYYDSCPLHKHQIYMSKLPLFCSPRMYRIRYIVPVRIYVEYTNIL